MKAPYRIGLQGMTKALYVERYEATKKELWAKLFNEFPVKRLIDVTGYWLIPTHTNPDRTLGTFLRLYDDGKIERITVREDQGDEIVTIKPADKDVS